MSGARSSREQYTPNFKKKRLNVGPILMRRYLQSIHEVWAAAVSTEKNWRQPEPHVERVCITQFHVGGGGV